MKTAAFFVASCEALFHDAVQVGILCVVPIEFSPGWAVHSTHLACVASWAVEAVAVGSLVASSSPRLALRRWPRAILDDDGGSSRSVFPRSNCSSVLKEIPQGETMPTIPGTPHRDVPACRVAPWLGAHRAKQKRKKIADSSSGPLVVYLLEIRKIARYSK